MEKEKFIGDVNDWNSHREALWFALESTSESELPILELGTGDGSTPLLTEYALEHNRTLVSYDNNAEYATKYNANYIADWSTINFEDYSVVLVDHAPSEQRIIDIAKLADKADYIVIHDSEPTEPASSIYQLDSIWNLFTYRKDYSEHNTWTTIVSNKFEL
jgi:hypothetical protein